MGILEDIFGPHEVVGTGPPAEAPPPPPPPDRDGDGLDDQTEFEYGTSHEDSDTDNDGLTDGEEWEAGTNPTRADSDNDGLNDYQETQQFGTDPLHWDTDRDGLSDGKEASYGADRFNPDTDGDGVLDGREVKLQTDPTDTDTDNDGLRDGHEINILGTSARKADTDGDGMSDKTEFDEGSNPRVNDFYEAQDQSQYSDLIAASTDPDPDPDVLVTERSGLDLGGIQEAPFGVGDLPDGIDAAPRADIQLTETPIVDDAPPDFVTADLRTADFGSGAAGVEETGIIIVGGEPAEMPADDGGEIIDDLRVDDPLASGSAIDNLPEPPPEPDAVDDLLADQLDSASPQLDADLGAETTEQPIDDFDDIALQ